MIPGDGSAKRSARARFDLRRIPVILGVTVVAAPISNQLYVAMAGLCALGLLAIQELHRGVIRKPDRSETWLLAFAGYAMASYLWAPPSMEVLARTLFVVYFGLAALFILTRRHGRDPTAWRFLGACYIAGVLVDGALIFADWRAGGIQDLGGRYSAAGVNSNYSAYAMVTAMPLLASLYWSGSRKALSAVAAAGVVAALGFAIALTGCRGAVIAYLCSALLWLLVELRRRPILAVSAAVGTAVASWRLWSVVQAIVPERLLMQAIDGQDFYSGRIDLWERALDAFEKNRAFGSGAESFPGTFGGGYFAHNVFLNLLAELGIAGMVIFVGVLWTIFSLLLRRALPGWARAAGAMLIAIWFTIAMTGVWLTAAPAWIAFGWLAGMPLLAPKAGQASRSKQATQDSC